MVKEIVCGVGETTACTSNITQTTDWIYKIQDWQLIIGILAIALGITYVIKIIGRNK